MNNNKNEAELLERYKVYLTEIKKRSPFTIRNYEGDLKKFQNYLDENNTEILKAGRSI